MCLSPHLAFSAYSEAAHPFVFGTFARSLRGTESISPSDRITYEHAIKRLLRDPGTRAAMVTPAGEPDELMAWAIGSEGCLVYAYVRYEYRLGKIGSHIGRELIEFVAGGRPCPAAIWTIDASRMAAHGYPIRYDLDRNQQLRQLAR